MPSDGFDPNHEPMDGEQYLQSVVYERTKCPAVVVKPFTRNPPDTNANEQKTSQSVWDQLNEVSFTHSNFLFVSFVELPFQVSIVLVHF